MYTHLHSVKYWFESSFRCPVCRAELDTKEQTATAPAPGSGASGSGQVGASTDADDDDEEEEVERLSDGEVQVVELMDADADEHTDMSPPATPVIEFGSATPAPLVTEVETDTPALTTAAPSVTEVETDTLVPATTAAPSVNELDTDTPVPATTAAPPAVTVVEVDTITTVPSV
jgi:hypothetical protein